jgi:hypothetical protein
MAAQPKTLADANAYCQDQGREMIMVNWQVVGRALRVAELMADRLLRGERAFLVHPQQPRVLRHIGGEYGGKAASSGHDRPNAEFSR